MAEDGLETGTGLHARKKLDGGPHLASLKTWLQLMPLPFDTDKRFTAEGFFSHFDTEASESVQAYDWMRLVSQTSPVLSPDGHFLPFSDPSETLPEGTGVRPLPPAERRLRVLRYLHKRAHRSTKMQPKRGGDKKNAARRCVEGDVKKQEGYC